MQSWHSTGRVRLSCVPWLLASLLVSGLLSSCSAGTSQTQLPSSGAIPPVSQKVGPSGMTVHFQGGWIEVPAGAVAQQQTLHIRMAPALPSTPATKLMHPLVTGVTVDLSGLQPLRPLTIVLSVPRTLPSGTRLQSMFVATVPSTGPAAPVLLTTRYNSADQMLVAQASHLSSFYPVWLDGQALVGQFTQEMADVLQIRAPQPACAGQKVSLPDGSTVQLVPGAWSSGADPLLWGCLASSDSVPGQVVVTLTDNRPMGYSLQIAPGASVSRDPPTLDSSTARLLFDIATLGKQRNLEMLTPASAVHVSAPGTGLPSGKPVTVGAVRVNPGVVAASAAQTAFLLAAGLLVPAMGISSKALDAALDTSGNLECLEGELANTASPGPDLIVSATQLGLQCLGTVLKGTRATLTLAVLGVVTSFFSTFTGMVNLLISYFTGANTFTVALQRTPALTQQPPTQQASPQSPTPQAPAPRDYPVNRQIPNSLSWLVTLTDIRVLPSGQAEFFVVYDNNGPYIENLSCLGNTDPSVNTVALSNGQTVAATADYCSQHPGDASIDINSGQTFTSYVIFPDAAQLTKPFGFSWAAEGLAGTLTGLQLPA